MTELCRTCGQEAEHTRELFSKESNGILSDLRKLTGIWLTRRPGVPTGICLSCVLDLNEAIVFRDRCLNTNNMWFQEEDNLEGMSSAVDKKEEPTYRSYSPEHIELKAVPSTALSPQKGCEQEDKQPNRSTVTDAQAAPIDEVLDPIMISKETIKVENEPLSDSDEHLKIIPLEAKTGGRKPINTDVVLVPMVINTETIKVEPPNSDTEREVSGGKEIVLLKAQPSGQSRNGEPIKKTQTRPKGNSDEIVTKKNRSQTARVLANELNKFFCDQCGKAFSEKGNLTLHLQRHTGVKQFECEECGRKEFSKHLLNLHIRVKHRGELPYMCKICGKRFGNCNRRLAHERSHDPRPRQYKCSVCDKGFTEKKFLKGHSVVHSREHPFQCDLCQTFFSQRKCLLTHLRSKRHWKKVEEQPKMQEDEDGPSTSARGRGNYSVNRQISV